MKKRLLLSVLLLLSVFCLGACQKNGSNVVQSTSGNESIETKKPSGDSAILVVSFGTSYNETRDITIGAIEKAIAEALPQYEFRRAFTSQIIIDKLKERDGLAIDNVEEALERAVHDGIKTLVVQPTHLMDGYEYTDLKNALQEYEAKFDKIVLGEPLLSSDSDYEAVVRAITEKTQSYDDKKTAICFMGHGTEADSNRVYTDLQNYLTDGGYENYYIGTVEAEPSLDDVMKELKKKDYKKVVLEPLMIVAGDHANNDMAGDEEDSWKSILTKAGYEVECLLEGLGQIPAIQEVYVSHAKAAQALSESNLEDSSKQEASSASLENGTYPIEVTSNSSMFRIVSAELTVQDGAMEAVITLSGTGYSKLYMGTAKEAETAKEDDFIPYEEDAEGAYTYRVPVKALDTEIECAAFSKKKEIWYDRKIVFKSPAKADGTYQMEVTLGGGSGKATVTSPTQVSVKDGKATAVVEWSSPNYDYMIVDGEKYLPVNEDGNSKFEIPVAKFDQEISVIADTIAMGTPHEIEYTLTFHS